LKELAMPEYTQQNSTLPSEGQSDGNTNDFPENWLQDPARGSGLPDLDNNSRITPDRLTPLWSSDSGNFLVTNSSQYGNSTDDSNLEPAADRLTPLWSSNSSNRVVTTSVRNENSTDDSNLEPVISGSGSSRDPSIQPSQRVTPAITLREHSPFDNDWDALWLHDPDVINPQQLQLEVPGLSAVSNVNQPFPSLDELSGLGPQDGVQTLASFTTGTADFSQARLRRPEIINAQERQSEVLGARAAPDGNQHDPFVDALQTFGPFTTRQADFFQAGLQESNTINAQQPYSEVFGASAAPNVLQPDFFDPLHQFTLSQNCFQTFATFETRQADSAQTGVGPWETMDLQALPEQPERLQPPEGLAMPNELQVVGQEVSERDASRPNNEILQPLEPSTKRKRQRFDDEGREKYKLVRRQGACLRCRIYKEKVMDTMLQIKMCIC
jgi:hypothetical protein